MATVLQPTSGSNGGGQALPAEQRPKVARDNLGALVVAGVLVYALFAWQPRLAFYLVGLILASALVINAPALKELADSAAKLAKQY